MSSDMTADTMGVVGTPDPGCDLVTLAEADPQRPRFHFTSPAGWLNDPNGVGRRDGEYHLFYQYNPHAPVHHRIHWGHATSRDLVTWTDQPVALVPDPGDAGPDSGGCWSGVLVDDDGAPTLVYSGHRDGELEVGCLATGSPDLRTWTKDPANPVTMAPADLDLVGFRDHCVWREGGMWRQLMGAGIRGVGGTTLLFESPDLRHWEYLGPLLVGDSAGGTIGGPPGRNDWTGDMWECIDLFRLAPDGTSTAPGEPGVTGGTDVLAFSVWSDDVTLHTVCLTGTYEGATFRPDGLHRLDFGQSAFYAPQSFADDDGRRVMFGWVAEERPEAASIEAGWSGAMSLPRLMTLDDDGAPAFAPAPEVAALRGAQHTVVAEGHPVALTDGLHLSGPTGDQLDLELDLTLAPGAVVHLVVRADPSGGEQTVIEVGRHEAGAGWLRLDRSRSSRDGLGATVERAGAIPIDVAGRVHLRVLIDHSVLEVFANGRALTSRVYAVSPSAAGTLVTAAGPEPGPGTDVRPASVLHRFEGWEVRSAWTQPRSLWPS